MQVLERSKASNGFQNGLGPLSIYPATSIRLLLVDEQVIVRQGLI
jgi:hypothetical protein